jgi:dolichyl-phosphate-mannose-protein mannosyltransferase
MNLSLPPEPLTPRQRTIALIVAVVCAATRFLALARSLWDWDEALFVLGMRHYDVAQHQPHPPGFPIYIAMGRMMRLVVGDDFRALQTVNIIAAVLLFPALFRLARELRLTFRTSVIAATLFAFFPNVWFFGGGAFSDIPSVVLVLFAVTLLFRGVRSRNAYWAGTLLLALAIGIRPQNLLLGLFPGICATRKRRPMEIVVALLIGVIVVGSAFGGAVAASGSSESYFRVVREHSEYISRVDSWRSPVRPPMWRLFDRFFIKQYQSPPLSILTTLFVIASVVGSIRERYRPMLFNVLTFAPFAIVAWAMLDRFSISRFSIGYQAMFALLAADGIRRVAKRYDAAVAAALAAAFIAYALPALTPVRNEIAPSVLAARAVAQHVDPRQDQLFVGHTMSKFLDLFAPGFPYTKVLDDRALPLAARPRAWLLAEITDTPETGFVFERRRGHLWNIARRHYFEIKLEPLVRRPRFLTGWYGPESMDIDEWRWMNGRSVTLLPPARGETMLRMHVGVPGETMPKNPRITVKLNGRVVDQFRTRDGYIERDYRVQPALRNLPNVLELSIDRTARLPDDTRELGLRLRYLGWGPV